MDHRRSILAALIAFGCVACDQGTKQLAVAKLRGQPPVEYLDRTVRFLYAENPGAWGSLGATWPKPVKLGVFIVLPLVVLAGAGWTVLRRPSSLRELVATALFVGGGIGNLIDRVAQGYVVDFMWLGRGVLATNVFNVADLAVVAGALMFLWGWRKKKEAENVDRLPRAPG